MQGDEGEEGVYVVREQQEGVSPTLRGQLLQIRRRSLGALLNMTGLLDWLQKHHTRCTLKKTLILLDETKYVYNQTSSIM